MGENYQGIDISIDPRYAIGTKFIHYASKREFEIVDYRITYFPKRQYQELSYVVKSNNGVQDVTNYDGISESTIFRSMPN